MRKILPQKGLRTFFLCSISILASYAALSQTVVTESNVRRQRENTFPFSRWVLYTRPTLPTAVGVFISGPVAPPMGSGSILLSTATTNEKISLFNFDHFLTRLSDIDNISYATYRLAGTASQLAAINLTIDYNGLFVPGGFATLVFEPAYNLNQQTVQNNVWQQWNATGPAVWWSTAPINGQCAGATTTCWQTWDYIVANNPNAVIIGGVGINQGTGNPGLTTAVDAFTFDQTTYDFDPFATFQSDIVNTENIQPALNNKAVIINKMQLASYPNPFTGTTRIQYQIEMDSRVSIVVYDASGKALKTLVNADQKAGSYSVNFNAAGLGNGVYYCKMVATAKGKVFTKTSSMLLTK